MGGGGGGGNGVMIGCQVVNVLIWIIWGLVVVFLVILLVLMIIVVCNVFSGLIVDQFGLGGNE